MWTLEEKREYHKQYYQEHKEERRSYFRDYMREYIKIPDAQLRQKVLSHYGNGKCACVWCGFEDIRALSIDHVNDNGNQHRHEIGKKYGISFYRWLRRENLPEGYQTLCMNCQFIKSHTKNK